MKLQLKFDLVVFAEFLMPVRIDITIITLVKAVIPNTSDGKIVRAVIKARIFRGQ